MKPKKEKVKLNFSLLPLEEVRDKCLSQVEFARRQYNRGKYSKDLVMAKQLIDLFGSICFYLKQENSKK